VRSGIQNPESVADHMYRMAVMGLLVNGTEYDHVKCLKLALVHDMAECESYLLFQFQ
jgi:putative hydrolase of HD superfamily